MTEDQRRYTRGGVARYIHRHEPIEVAVHWGPGYPPVELADHLFDYPESEFTREGDDPTANLEIPEPEPEPE